MSQLNHSRENWNTHPDPGAKLIGFTCPWCGVESLDEDSCDECGKPMCGSDHYECPYCGTIHFELVQCCSEMHSERFELPRCPKCKSADFTRYHVSAENAGAAGCDTDYKVCDKCDTQFDHQ